MNTMMEVIKTLQQAVARQAKQAMPSAYDTMATVRRIEGSTAWVHIDGGVDETPVELTIDAKEGDNVQIRISGGRAFIIGNKTAPPTDDTVAIKAETQARAAKKSAGEAYDMAAKALENIGGNTEQYFWHTETGIDTGSHITQIPQEQFVDNPSGGNTLIRSNGVALREGLTELARFSADGIQIGEDEQMRLVQSAHAVQMFSEDNAINMEFDTNGAVEPQTTYVKAWTAGERLTNFTIPHSARDTYLSHDADDMDYYGVNTLVFRLEQNWPEDSAGLKITARPIFNIKTASDDPSVCPLLLDNIRGTTGSTNCSLALSDPVYWSEGAYDVYTKLELSPELSFELEDGQTATTRATAYVTLTNNHLVLFTITGYYSGGHTVDWTFFAVQSYISPYLKAGYTEGWNAYDYTVDSYAPCFTLGEPSSSQYKGSFSVRLGRGLTASSSCQTAIGKYNKNKSANAFEIGNGTADNARSNALTVDWLGNVMAQGMAGMIQMFAGSTAPTGWLMCDGSAVSRTRYATLFAVIGTTYGTGDGSTTFNLPDLRGRMPLGSSSSHSLASTGGSEYIQAHTHSNTIKAKTPKFTHSISSSNSNVNLLGGGSEQSYGKAGSGGSTYPYKRLSIADHAATDCTMSGSVGAVSGATTGNEGNMPPFLTINYIIATGNTA